MAADTSFLYEKRKVREFEELFSTTLSKPLRRWENEYELALAVGDDEAALKEKIKVDAARHILQLCQTAAQEKTLGAAVEAFSSSVQEVADIIEQRLEEAKAAGNKDKEIAFRIELGIYDKPVKGFLTQTLKSLGKHVSDYQEFLDREY